MKASNGMGTIVKLSGKRRKPFVLKGQGVFTEKGYHQPVIASFATKKEAEAFRIAYFNNKIKELEEDNIKVSKKEKILIFEDLYKIWLENKNPSETTLKNYTSYFNNSYKIHKLDIKNINGILLQKIFNELDLSKGTLRNLKSFWKQIFDFAVLNDFCEKEYVSFLKLPKEEKGKRTGNRERIFTNDELKILWDNLHNKIDRFNLIDIILINCYTGLRANELLNITNDKVFLEERYIDITKSKSRAGIRKLPISDKIYELIKNRYKENDDFLFKRYDGEILTYDTYDYEFREVIQDLELNYHTLHDCRHTFATLLANAEIDKEIIIKLTGHSSYKITSEKYIHKTLNNYREAINKI